jgi:hypothetical protein
MAKAKNEVIAFNAGELGAEALARVDLANYPRGAETMENILPLTQGGMTKAPGTQYIAGTPSNAVALLRPFIFSESDRFTLELSENKMRFVFEDGLVTLTGAVATVGTFSDESATAPSGGGAAPGAGTGDFYFEYDFTGTFFGVYA